MLLYFASSVATWILIIKLYNHQPIIGLALTVIRLQSKCAVLCTITITGVYALILQLVELLDKMRYRMSVKIYFKLIRRTFRLSHISFTLKHWVYEILRDFGFIWIIHYCKGYC